MNSLLLAILLNNRFCVLASGGEGNDEHDGIEGDAMIASKIVSGSNVALNDESIANKGMTASKRKNKGASKESEGQSEDETERLD